VDLGRVGIWTFTLDLLPSSQALEVAAELESLGYGALWIPEAVGREPFVSATLLLSGTASLKVATGIASIYGRDPMTAAAAWRTIEEAFPQRFLLGLGVSHQPMVEGVRGHTYERPLQAMERYLDAMDASMFVASAAATTPNRALAALGPRMLALSAAKATGAHPYFVPVEHTAIARGVLGDGPLLAPEQAVVLSTDPDVARAIARAHMSVYLTLPNYTNNLKRLGFTDADIADGGSDTLVDAIVAWGSLDDIAARVRAHHDAGADHVCVQVLTPQQGALPIAEWRELAPALL
jgi:probable F420-dependent oxidoreductase